MVDALLDGFAAGGGDRERAFFCTSQPDTAVPFGHALDPSVLTNLRASSIVLFVVTENSVGSPACQREMGAAQVLRIPTVPLMHPRFEDWADMLIPINFHRGARLRCESELESLRDDLAKRFGWTDSSLGEWQAAMKRLRMELNGWPSSCRRGQSS